MNPTLATKPRYEVLDALRGVAAFMVVLFHMGETYATPTTQMINHGYLAVDFFFILSGFVVGYAYDDRWSKMSLWDFFKRRLVRLQPMVIMGTIFGAALYGFGQCEGFPKIGNVSGWQVALCFVMGCLMIPCGPRLDIRGWREMNSFNGPNWTLTWEYLANILYALVLRFLPTAVLVVLTLAAAFCTIDLCFDINIFGLLTETRAEKAYSVIGGWSITPEQLYIGFTRLMFPFLCGLVLARAKRVIKMKHGFIICSALLVTVFSVPYVGAAPSIWNGAYNAAVILLVFPLVVLMGAGSSNPKGERSRKFCTLLGEISYPLYITHYPILYVHMSWAWEHPEAPLYMHILTGAGAVVLSLGTAYAMMRLYDLPVRKWLTDKFLK